MREKNRFAGINNMQELIRKGKAELALYPEGSEEQAIILWEMNLQGNIISAMLSRSQFANSD